MRRFNMFVGAVALSVLSATLVPSAQADDTPVAKTARKAKPAASQLDGKTTGHNIRASQLIGMNIQNSQGKSVGEINDIVLDSSSGKVRYAAVTYGGFLGVGNKMFAVPFAALKVQRDIDDADEIVLVLDVTQSQLEGSTGFDEDHWPNFADAKFTSEVDNRYGVQRQGRIRDRLRNRVDVDVNRNGVDVDVDRKGVDVDVKRD